MYNSLSDVFPTLSEIGLDFLNDLFTYDPDRRINAKEALRHRYFRCSPHPADPGLMPTFPSLHGNISDFVDEESLKSESING